MNSKKQSIKVYIQAQGAHVWRFVVTGWKQPTKTLENNCVVLKDEVEWIEEEE